MDLIDEEDIMWLECSEHRDDISRLGDSIACDDMEVFVIDIGDNMSECRLAIATRSAEEDMSECMIALVSTIYRFLEYRCDVFLSDKCLKGYRTFILMRLLCCDPVFRFASALFFLFLQRIFLTRVR